jgi:hypothetical protein
MGERTLARQGGNPCYQPCYQTEKTSANCAERISLNKPDPTTRISFRRYRTQEVAGSSPASSIRKVPANGVIRLHRTNRALPLIYLRATKLSYERRDLN